MTALEERGRGPPRGQSPGAAGSAQQGTPSSMVSALWPLVGRDEELALVGKLLAQEQASGVVIAGAPGVGKTRLAAEALRGAKGAGRVTAWATATHAAATIPFAALAHLLPESGRLGRNPLDVLRGARRALAELAGGRRLVLAVDDAHLLDAGSAALVHQLAISGTAQILVTVHPAEQAPDPIVALWKDRLFAYVELQPLARHELEELLMRVLGGEIEASTVHRLWNACGGNVLFLRELVLDGLDRGVLTRTDGFWRWRGEFAGGQRMSELIEARLGQLSAEERELLEFVALGEPLEAADLQARAPLARLEALERRGLLAATHDGHRVDYRSGHPLYGELLRACASPLRARAVRRQLADALERRAARRPGDLLRLASWRLESPEAAPAELFLAAAGRAEAAFDPSLAERLAQAAVDAGGGFAAQLALAEALRGQGRCEDAEALLASLAETAETDAERARIAHARAINLHWGLRRFDRAEVVLEAARASVADDEARDLLTALAAWLACARTVHSSRPLEAIEISSEILGRESVDERLGVHTALAAAPALAIAGRAHDAVALVERWQEPARRLTGEIPDALHQLEVARVVALALGGYLHEAYTRGEATYRAAVAEGTHEGQAVWTMHLGAVAIARGKLADALRLLGESAALLREFDPLGSLSWTLALTAQARAQRGDPRAAEAALAEAEDVRGGGGMVHDFCLRLARAWVAAARGHLSRARTLAHEAAEAALTSGQLGFAVTGFHDLARLGDPAAAAPRLASLVDLVQGPMASVCATHAAAIVDGDAEELERSAAAFADIGALLRAAEAAADASVAHRGQGRTAAARAAAARAELLRTRCEGTSTPALAAAGPVEELTPREHEVAALAASGLSNRQVADRLVVSVRTVENHLQHVYGKLGVSDRGALAALLQTPAPE